MRLCLYLREVCVVRQSVKFIILTVILVMMILLAVFGYHYLTERYDIPNPTDIGSANARSGSGGFYRYRQRGQHRKAV